jgi:hypothetical protein
LRKQLSSGLGYGWTETSSAQIAVSTLFDSPGGIFSHTHNLFLDLAIWLGIPLACITAGVCVYWLRAVWVRLSATEDFIVLLLIIVVVIHSMLEFPLHYGYFLIPTGMLIGVLNARLGLKFKGGKWGSQYVALCLLGAVFWLVTVKDYVEVEDSYRLLTLEQGILGQGRPAFGGPPEVLVLTHLREWVRLARVKPNDHMSGDELAQLETMAKAYPSMPNSFNLAKALAWNGQADRARHWLTTGCRFSTQKECNLIKKSWREDAAIDDRLANVGWPE